MLEPIGHQHTFSVGCLDEVLKRIELAIMEGDDLPVIGVHSSVCQLQQLTRKTRSIRDRHLSSVGVEDQILPNFS